MNIELTEPELLLRLHDTEASFTERKTKGDLKDILKTVVAFANSAPIGYPAVLFVGVRNDGTPEKNLSLDSIQLSVATKIEAAYPSIYYVTRIIRIENQEVLAIIVPGSQQRPHFSGKAYTRLGSKTVEASEQEFDRLIAERNAPVYEILKWKDRTISFHLTLQDGGQPHQGTAATVIDCNQFYVTLQYNNQRWSYALRATDISFDHIKQCLALGIDYR